MNTISVVIPTYNAGNNFCETMKSVAFQIGITSDDIWIIDSSSVDDTVKIAKRYGVHVKCISKSEFGHGKTRAMAVDMLNSKYIVFLTQDAVLSSRDSIIKLCKPLEENTNIGVTYGRQLPVASIGDIGNHARIFNYPPVSRLKSREDIPLLGLKTIFCSNSFAAYNRASLLSVGNFPDVKFGEDTLAAANLVSAGYSIFYNGEACVLHSHEFSLYEEFKRYVAIGKLHRKYSYIFDCFGSTTGEGFRFVQSEIKYLLAQHEYWLLPVAFAHNGAKFLGYRLGKLGVV